MVFTNVSNEYKKEEEEKDKDDDDDKQGEKKKTCFYDQINSDSDHSKKPGLKRKLWV